MNKKDIILINVPFTDLSDRKLRPALIIGKTQDDFIVCFISSKESNYTKCDTCIIANKQNGLRVNSIIKCAKLFTLHHSLIKVKLGIIDKDIYNKVIKNIVNIIN